VAGGDTLAYKFGRSAKTYTAVDFHRYQAMPNYAGKCICSVPKPLDTHSKYKTSLGTLPI